jgi:hypothetical protein
MNKIYKSALIALASALSTAAMAEDLPKPDKIIDMDFKGYKSIHIVPTGTLTACTQDNYTVSAQFQAVVNAQDADNLPADKRGNFYTALNMQKSLLEQAWDITASNSKSTDFTDNTSTKVASDLRYFIQKTSDIVEQENLEVGVDVLSVTISSQPVPGCKIP